MKAIELTVTRIGNSRGIRLPAKILKKHGITGSVLLEERDDELVLRPKRKKKLSWKDTFAEMAKEREDWGAFDAAARDGLDEH